MDIIHVSLKDAYDTPAQDRRILAALRKRGLLNKNHVFRGFKRENLDKLLKSGIDHDPGRPTFLSTKPQLGDDREDSRDENALEYALHGGCLAVYVANAIPTDGAGGYCVPTDIRDHLVAVIILQD